MLNKIRYRFYIVLLITFFVIMFIFGIFMVSFYKYTINTLQEQSYDYSYDMAKERLVNTIDMIIGEIETENKTVIYDNNKVIQNLLITIKNGISNGQSINELVNINAKAYTDMTFYIYDYNTNECMLVDSTRRVIDLKTYDEFIDYIESNPVSTYYDFDEINKTVAITLSDDILYEKVLGNVSDCVKRVYKGSQNIWINKIIDYQRTENFCYNIFNLYNNKIEGEFFSLDEDGYEYDSCYLNKDEFETIVNKGYVISEYSTRNEVSGAVNKKLVFSKLYSKYDWIISGSIFLNNFDALYNQQMSSINHSIRNITIAVILSCFLMMSVLFIALCSIERIYYKKIEKEVIEERFKSQEEFKQLKISSEKDNLTKVYNRKYIENIMIKMFNDYLNTGVSSSVIMVDIDNFKSINDTYGHIAGDNVLITIAKVMKDSIRGNDIIARWGGEEFIVFINNTSIKNAHIVAEKIRSEVEKNEINLDNKAIKVTISLGVSSFNNTDENFSNCVERADKALYKSKHSGKNKVTDYEL